MPYSEPFPTKQAAQEAIDQEAAHLRRVGDLCDRLDFVESIETQEPALLGHFGAHSHTVRGSYRQTLQAALGTIAGNFAQIGNLLRSIGPMPSTEPALVFETKDAVKAAVLGQLPNAEIAKMLLAQPTTPPAIEAADPRVAAALERVSAAEEEAHLHAASEVLQIVADELNRVANAVPTFMGPMGVPT